MFSAVILSCSVANGLTKLFSVFDASDADFTQACNIRTFNQTTSGIKPGSFAIDIDALHYE